MECAQIQITGGGSTTRSPTTSFPGAYSASDPGIYINIYDTVTNYTVPGKFIFIYLNNMSSSCVYLRTRCDYLLIRSICVETSKLLTSFM